MQFTKIKVNDKGVQLMWTTTDASGLVHAHDVSSPEKPAPELPDALAAFVPFVMDLLDLPAKWRDQIRVTTVSLNLEKESGTRGLMVSVTKKIAKASGRPVSITTPHMREAGEDSNATTGILDDETLEMIGVVEKAAIAFINGDRMQGELIPTKADAPAPAAGESDIEKAKKKRGGKDKGFIPGGGRVVNAEQDQPPTDANLRALLLSVDRDVPEDALALFTSNDRNAIQSWATQVVDHKAGRRKAKPDGEPEMLKKYATPGLGDDGWTDPTPPPKAADVAPATSRVVQ